MTITVNAASISTTPPIKLKKHNNTNVKIYL
jgi:hypothetical protein